MKALLFYLFFLLFLLRVSLCCGQESRISRISFSYQDARGLVKPNYNWIQIVISHKNFYNRNDYTMRINSNSSSMEDHAKHAAFKDELEFARISGKEDTIAIKNKIELLDKSINNVKDKIILLSKEQFGAIVKAVYSIEVSEAKNSFVANGIHGYYVSIEFGTTQESIQYRRWAPGLRGKRRGNPNFSAACRLILEMAGINPRKVL